MKWFWRIIFIVGVTVAAYFGWQQKLKRDERALDEKEIARLLNPSGISSTSDVVLAQQAFGRALLIIDKYSHEAITKDHKDKEITGMQPLVWKALRQMPCSSEEQDMIAESLLSAHTTVTQAGGFSDRFASSNLEDGNWPELQSGPFKGDRLKLSWRVNPVVAPKVRSHPGNFVLVPESVWGMEDDGITNETLSYARRFRNAGYLLGDDWIRLAEAYSKQTGKNL
jgi:hypothetical protein